MPISVDHGMLVNLYATAEHEARWTPVLDALCAALGMRSAVVQLLDVEHERAREIWNARDTYSLAHANLHDRCINTPDNPRLTRSVDRAACSEVGSDIRYFSKAPTQMDDLRDRLGRSGLGHAIWASFPLADRRHFSLILHRETGDARDLDEAEEAFLHNLMPHLKQAARLNARLAAASASTSALESAIDQLGFGLILCDGDMALLRASAVTAELLERSGHLRIAGDRLLCPEAEDGRRLRAAVRTVADGVRPAAAGVLGDGSSRQLHFRIMPLPHADWTEAGTTVAILLSQPADTPCIDPGDIGLLFRLSPAEARLATALASGKSVTDFAHQRGITLGTARVQLKQVLAKTGTNRQAELIRRLCRSVATRSGSPLSQMGDA